MRYVTLLFLSTCLLHGADKPTPKYDLNDFSWGKTIAGPTLTPAKLKDKGVVLVAWAAEKVFKPSELLGILQGVADEYKDKLAIVAVEVSQFEKTSKEISGFVKQAKVTFTVTSVLKRNPVGEIRTIPYVFVFNSAGKMIYDGSINDEAFREALKEAATPVPKGDPKKPASKPVEEPKKVDPKKAA